MDALRKYIFIIIMWQCCASLALGDNRLESGKQQYEIIQKEITASPKYSQCWLDAIRSLESGCKALTDDIQHRLSLKFTNCFLEKSGRQKYPCPEIETLDQCTKNMPGESFGVYTNFFTHTQNMCYFLQSQVWQEKTDHTINRLEQSSENVAEQMENSSAQQRLLLDMQSESLKLQESIVSHSNQLMESVKTSALSVRSMTNDFMQALFEQKSLIFGVFEKLSSLQTLVLGELTGFYSFIFYLISVFLCYLLTSTQRTHGARFWLFLLMTGNVCLERIIASAGANPSLDVYGGAMDESEIIYWRLWLCRKLCIGLGIILYLWHACRYRDINVINNHMLIQIQKQNEEIQRMLQDNNIRLNRNKIEEREQIKPKINFKNNADADLNKQKFMNRPGTLLDIPYSPIDSPDSPIVAGHIERPVLSKIPPTPDSVTNEGSASSSLTASRRRRRRLAEVERLGITMNSEEIKSHSYNLRNRSARTAQDLNTNIQQEFTRSNNNLGIVRQLQL